MTYYAVIDTNVFISALLSKQPDSATVQVLDAVIDGKIIPLYHQDILAEYDEVLQRSNIPAQKEEYFEDSGYYKYHEAYHLLKFANEKQILEKAYKEYLNLKKRNLWGLKRSK